MKILIVEDDNLACHLLEVYLGKLGYTIFDRAINVEGSIELLKKNNYDLILLDMHLEESEGIDLIDHIPSSSNIIFTTSDPTFAVQAFEANAMDYLLKPFTEERFSEALKKIRTAKPADSVVIKADLVYHKIPVSSILYINSNKDYLTVHTGERSYTFLGKIPSFMEKLPAEQFAQCHRSYLVNLQKVTSYRDTSVNIDDIEIPVSRQKKKAFFQNFLHQ
jgi:DNA-binding LytR/AlgR family response regulator